MQDTNEFREVVIGLCEEAIDNQAKQINSIEEKLKVLHTKITDDVIHFFHIFSFPSGDRSQLEVH